MNEKLHIHRPKYSIVVGCVTRDWHISNGAQSCLRAYMQELNAIIHSRHVRMRSCGSFPMAMLALQLTGVMRRGRRAIGNGREESIQGGSTAKPTVQKAPTETWFEKGTSQQIISELRSKCGVSGRIGRDWNRSLSPVVSRCLAIRTEAPGGLPR